MTRADIFGGLLLAAFFAAALWEGWSFQYGTEFAPGPGFAPVWLSAIGLCVSLLIAYALLLSRLIAGARSASERPGMLVIMAIATAMTPQMRSGVQPY